MPPANPPQPGSVDLDAVPVGDQAQQQSPEPAGGALKDTAPSEKESGSGPRNPHPLEALGLKDVTRKDGPQRAFILINYADRPGADDER